MYYIVVDLDSKFSNLQITIWGVDFMIVEINTNLANWDCVVTVGLEVFRQGCGIGTRR